MATNASSELGYRHDGVEIIVDKDTFRAGQTAPVMISTFTSDRYVLFSVEAEDLYSYRVIHVTGTAKLLSYQSRSMSPTFISALMVTTRMV